MATVRKTKSFIEEKYYKTEDLRHRLGYGSCQTLLYGMKKAKKDTLLYDIWACRLPVKIGKHIFYTKKEVDTVYKIYKI